MAVCAFGHESVPEDWLVAIETKGAKASICPRCLTLIIVHRRVHHMKLEQLITQMTTPEDRS